MMKYMTRILVFALLLSASAVAFAADTPAVTSKDTPNVTIKDAPKAESTPVVPAIELPGVPADAKTLKKVNGIGTDWNYRTVPVNVLGKSYDNNAYINRRFTQSVYFDIQGSVDTLSTDIAYADTSKGMSGDVKIELDGVIYKTLNINQGEAPKHLEVPFTGKKQLRITPSDESILFLNPRLLSGNKEVAAPVVAAPVAEPLVDKLVAFIIGMRASALGQNNKTYADSLEKSLLDMGIKLTDTPGAATTWIRVEAAPAPPAPITPPTGPTLRVD